jgi:hypothetical protein
MVPCLLHDRCRNAWVPVATLGDPTEVRSAAGSVLSRCKPEPGNELSSVRKASYWNSGAC